MADESLLTEEMLSQIGNESEDMVLEIEKSVVMRFVEAVEDPNPLWQDEEYAKKTIYGGLMAPPNLLCTVIAGAGGGRLRVKSSTPRRGGVAGGDELELFQPVMVGDVITSRAKLIDIQERTGKDGTKRIYAIVETTFKNQNGELVATDRSTSISW